MLSVGIPSTAEIQTLVINKRVRHLEYGKYVFGIRLSNTGNENWCQITYGSRKCWHERTTRSFVYESIVNAIVNPHTYYYDYLHNAQTWVFSIRITRPLNGNDRFNPKFAYKRQSPPLWSQDHIDSANFGIRRDARFRIYLYESIDVLCRDQKTGTEKYWLTLKTREPYPELLFRKI